MAEIEHFVDPLNKSHKKFHSVKDDLLPLLTKQSQTTHRQLITDLPLHEAVS